MLIITPEQFSSSRPEQIIQLGDGREIRARKITSDPEGNRLAVWTDGGIAMISMLAQTSNRALCTIENNDLAKLLNVRLEASA